MFWHALKLAWRRKRANALVILEILISFGVLATVVVGTLMSLSYYRVPLGYDWHDVWNVELSTDLDPGQIPDTGAFDRVLEEVAAFDEVVAAATTMVLPYGFLRMGIYIDEKGRNIYAEVIEASDGFAEVMRLDLVAGRWFQEADDALDWEPVVLDLGLAHELFGDEDPVGRRLPGGEQENRRVVGLVSTYRVRGELWPQENVMMRRADLDKTYRYLLPQLVVRVEPGTGAAFRQRLVKRVGALLPGWSARIRPLEEMREEAFRGLLMPLLLQGLVAGFLLLMVALGLIGVLWQNVVGRTRELGLRRAMGATDAHIHRQVLGELAATATLAMGVGVLLAVQVPMLDVVPGLSPGVFAAGLGISLALMYTLVLACGLYPSWLAARVHPAQALAYE